MSFCVLGTYDQAKEEAIVVLSVVKKSNNNLCDAINNQLLCSRVRVSVPYHDRLLKPDSINHSGIMRENMEVHERYSRIPIELMLPVPPASLCAQRNNWLAHDALNFVLLSTLDPTYQFRHFRILLP